MVSIEEIYNQLISAHAHFKANKETTPPTIKLVRKSDFKRINVHDLQLQVDLCILGLNLSLFFSFKNVVLVLSLCVKLGIQNFFFSLTR